MSCHDHSMFKPKTPHFFKIILQDTIRDGKLAIPKRFLRDYGNCLPNSLLLKVPSGAVWQVQLTKCDGEVWLQNGWQEFAEYYSVALGYFLVFRYEGICHFNVLIFDTSASEIEYPCTSTNLDGEFQNPKIKAEDNISLETLDDFSLSRKSREKSPLPCRRPHKMIRTSPTNKIESTSRPKDNESGGLNFPVKKGAGSKTFGNRCQQTEVLKEMKPLIANEKGDAFQRASAFKSKNPFFKIVMQPSYVHQYKLSIPAAFAKRCFVKNQGDVILCISDGRTWSIKYCRKGALGAKLFDGWRAFVQDNNLKVGDVCVFELIKGSEISFNVVIFRVVEHANCRLSRAHKRGASQVKPKRSSATKIESDWTGNEETEIPGSCDQLRTKEIQFSEGKSEVEPSKFEQLIHEERAGMQLSQRPSCLRAPGTLEAANKFISKYPFFKVALRKTTLEHSNVSIPLGFIEEHLKLSKAQNVTLKVAEKSWHVKLLSYSNFHVGRFSGGWRAFARENSLQEGDVCVFEVIKRDDAVLKVTIFRCVS